MSKTMNKSMGFIFAALAGALWGVSGIIGQFLFEYKQIAPTWLVSYRMVIAGIILIVFLKIRKIDVMCVWKEKEDRNWLILYAVAGMMMVQFSFFKSIESSNSPTATVLQYLNPTMMLIFFALKTRIMPAVNEWTAVGMGLLGTFMVATGGDVHTLKLSPLGLTWGLGCSIITCIYTILPIRLLKKFDALIICGWAMVIGGIVLCIITRPWTLAANVDIEVILCMIILIIFGTIIPFSISLMAISVIGPVKSNLMSSIEPVVVAILGFFLFGLMFSIGELIGFALIIATIFVLAMNRNK